MLVVGIKVRGKHCWFRDGQQQLNQTRNGMDVSLFMACISLFMVLTTSEYLTLVYSWCAGHFARMTPKIAAIF